MNNNILGYKLVSPLGGSWNIGQFEPESYNLPRARRRARRNGDAVVAVLRGGWWRQVAGPRVLAGPYWLI